MCSLLFVDLGRKALRSIHPVAVFNVDLVAVTVQPSLDGGFVNSVYQLVLDTSGLDDQDRFDCC